MLPTFLGLGAQRAGTTWLYGCLAEHPQVFMSRKKELYFFHVNYERGLDWYQQQFEAAGAALARGEITPDYMYRDVALRRIAQDLPGVRCLIMLRDPIERAISAFALHVDRYRGLTFREAAERHPELVDRGLYSRHLQTVLRFVSREQLRVLFYDDVVERPGQLLDDVFEFIGVETGFRPAAIGRRVNRIIYPDLQKTLAQLRLGMVVDLVKRSAVGTWIRRQESFARKQSGTATPQDLRWLADYYAQDVRELASVTGRDLGHWLT